jgi:mono/diheme cytochrome c family protein
MAAVLLLSGCSGASSAESAEMASEPDVEMEEAMEESGPKDYGVPAEDAAVANPVPADDASLQAGEATYVNTCLKCHGEEGRGDGPSATNPTDFRAEHVIELTDGELFYIITNGIEGSEMQAWNFLDEAKRWNLVNYIRTLQE